MTGVKSVVLNTCGSNKTNRGEINRTITQRNFQRIRVYLLSLNPSMHHHLLFQHGSLSSSSMQLSYQFIFGRLTWISRRSSCFLLRSSITIFCCSGVRSKRECTQLDGDTKNYFLHCCCCCCAFRGNILNHESQLTLIVCD